jgi:histidinol dehydrogenase
MMEIIRYPNREQWTQLLQRPQNPAQVGEDKVLAILQAVRERGDNALREFGRRFDRVELKTLAVSPEELQNATRQVSPELRQAIQLAIENITRFHKTQLIEEPPVETSPGVICRRKNVAIERVGLYIPGGTAPLFSTVLMLAVPAQIAGCSEIVLCTPSDCDGNVNPVILYAARQLGLTKVFKVGGAQAIAAMAYGTESIPKVDKIFGPGNSWVTLAKQLVRRDTVAVDIPAGPSEVAVIADESADPEFVAADLLSQAEHGIDSQVILFAISGELIDDVTTAVERQLKALPRKEIAQLALQNSRIFLLPDLEEAMAMANQYAPEHLILMTSNAEELAEKVINAGSVFIGAYTPESAGDYASGTNHTLPTYGYARSYSGVSVDSFIKKITFQSISEKGLRSIGPAIATMATAEGLNAHKYAVSVRLAKLNKQGAE